jgi:hypothetical protein
MKPIHPSKMRRMTPPASSKARQAMVLRVKGEAAVGRRIVGGVLFGRAPPHVAWSRRWVRSVSGDWHRRRAAATPEVVSLLDLVPAHLDEGADHGGAGPAWRVGGRSKRSWRSCGGPGRFMVRGGRIGGQWDTIRDLGGRGTRGGPSDGDEWRRRVLSESIIKRCALLRWPSSRWASVYLSKAMAHNNFLSLFFAYFLFLCFLISLLFEIHWYLHTPEHIF